MTCDYSPEPEHELSNPVIKENLITQIAPKAPDFLKAAAKHMEDRASTFDKPEGERSMAQTVAIFNLYHGTNLTEAQGWHFMETVKNVRFFTNKGFHRDSGEDGIAYAALKTEAKQREV